MDDRLKKADVSELGELKTAEDIAEEKSKKKKTGLFAPIIYTIAGIFAWISLVLGEQIGKFSEMANVILGNREASGAVSELGTQSSNAYLQDLISNYGWLIILGILLLIFTVIGIVGVCKLITRLFRRSKYRRLSI